MEVMGDVTYGALAACCIDNFTARALHADFLVTWAQVVGFTPHRRDKRGLPRFIQSAFVGFTSSPKSPTGRSIINWLRGDDVDHHRPEPFSVFVPKRWFKHQKNIKNQPCSCASSLYLLFCVLISANVVSVLNEF
jgi:hypothetical protein